MARLYADTPPRSFGPTRLRCEMSWLADTPAILAPTPAPPFKRVLLAQPGYGAA
jgi:hypothetical protein